MKILQTLMTSAEVCFLCWHNLDGIVTEKIPESSEEQFSILIFHNATERVSFDIWGCPQAAGYVCLFQSSKAVPSLAKYFHNVDFTSRTTIIQRPIIWKHPTATKAWTCRTRKIFWASDPIPGRPLCCADIWYVLLNDRGCYPLLCNCNEDV